MRYLIACGLGIILWGGCTPEGESTPAEAATPLDFQTRRFDRQGGICGDDGSDCIRISLRYPEATGGSPAFQATFNGFVHQFLVSVLDEDPDGTGAPLDTLVERLLADYGTYTAESDMAMAWSLEVKGEVLYRTPSRVSVQLNSYSYMGGAHPNTYTTLGTFELASGDQLALSDLVRDTTAFRQLAETAFRAAHDIPAGQDLGEAGFYFSADSFVLPANFALHPEGILLHYNAYEVGPYALGATRFVIDRATLGDLLR